MRWSHDAVEYRLGKSFDDVDLEAELVDIQRRGARAQARYDDGYIVVTDPDGSVWRGAFHQRIEWECVESAVARSEFENAVMEVWRAHPGDEHPADYREVHVMLDNLALGMRATLNLPEEQRRWLIEQLGGTP